MARHLALICLLCWWSLRHVLSKMIFEIIALMRAGRIHAGKPGDQLRQEIQSGHRQMLEAVEASNTDALTGLFFVGLAAHLARTQARG